MLHWKNTSAKKRKGNSVKKTHTHKFKAERKSLGILVLYLKKKRRGRVVILKTEKKGKLYKKKNIIGH